jgi:hypothetical protein
MSIREGETAKISTSLFLYPILSCFLLSCSSTTIGSSYLEEDTELTLDLGDCPPGSVLSVESIKYDGGDNLLISISITNDSETPFLFELPNKENVKVYAFEPGEQLFSTRYDMIPPNSERPSLAKEMSILKAGEKELFLLSTDFESIVFLTGVHHPNDFPSPNWVVHLEFWPKLLAQDASIPGDASGDLDVLSYDCGSDGFVDEPQKPSAMRYLIADQRSVR